MSKDLCTSLGRKAKELVEGMRKRVKRDPDVADYAVAFESVLACFDREVTGADFAADALAKERYYTVEHRSPGTFWRPQFEWLVTGFRDGKLVLQTGHTAQVSMQMECQAWEMRGYIRKEPAAVVPQPLQTPDVSGEPVTVKAGIVRNEHSGYIHMRVKNGETGANYDFILPEWAVTQSLTRT